MKIKMNLLSADTIHRNNLGFQKFLSESKIISGAIIEAQSYATDQAVVRVERAATILAVPQADRVLRCMAGRNYEKDKNDRKLNSSFRITFDHTCGRCLRPAANLGPHVDSGFDSTSDSFGG